MGIGNMISRLLNNESKEEKDERLNISEEKEPVDVSTQGTVEKTVDEVVAKEDSQGVSTEASGELTEEKVLEVLSEVYDPEIPIDIVNLGLIYGIDIDGRNVVITMTMTAPGCPASTQIAGESKLMVEELPTVDSVDIDIVWDPPWDPSKMSEEAQQSMGMI
ncbi:MAG: dTDP-4-keto-l-rhamnose reductase related [Thermodesulfobacteriota bacterium]|nr:MAG: dTDP-4-keto-l-rhamnose reductase related [Thermodesulfobacteriota bacterium]